MGRGRPRVSGHLSCVRDLGYGRSRGKSVSVWSISGTVREHGVSDRAECGVGVSDGDGDGVRVLSPESTQFISEGSRCL